MATKLKNLKITKVDFVDEGANPDADIGLRKRKEDGETVEKGGSATFAEALGGQYLDKISEDIWNLCYAMNSSLCSILFDDEMDWERKQAAMLESLNEFADVTKESVTTWASGKPVGFIAKADAVTDDRFAGRMAEMLAKALERMPKKADGQEPEAAETEGEETSMRIDKTKLNAEELAALEAIEKKAGIPDEAPTEGATASVAEDGQEVQPTAKRAPVEPTAKTEPVSEDDGPDGIYKGMTPAARAEFEALRKFRQDTEDEKLREIASGYEILGKSADDLFPVLKSLKAKDQNAYDLMLATLNESKTAVEKSGAFSEIGKSGNGSVNRGGAVKEVESKAVELMKSKDGNGLTMAQAIDRVLLNDPDLAHRYETEDE